MNGLLADPLFMAGMGLLSGNTPQRTRPNSFQNMLDGMQIAEKNQQGDLANRLALMKFRQPIKVGNSLVDPMTMKPVYTEPKEAQVMSPGSVMIDPTTQAPIYKAPFKPDVKSPEAFQQDLTLAKARATGTSVSFDENGNPIVTVGPVTDMTKKTIGGIEEKQASGIRLLNDLHQIGTRYADEYLTYGGKAKRFALEKADKAGLASSEQQEFLGREAQFRTAVDRMFNQYRKEITGAAASHQELERLKKTMLNTDMSPAQFRAAYNDFVTIARQQLELHSKLRSMGLSDQDITARLDEAFSQLELSTNETNAGASEVIDWNG